MELMGKKEFVAIVFDVEHKIFIVDIMSFSFTMFLSSTPFDTDIYPFHRFQIAGLIAKKAFIKVFDKYVNFADVFSLDLTSKLFKHTKINDHTIKVVNSQQLPYKLIYSLKLVELETLKAYIETNLVNRFIKSSKSPTSAPIFLTKS